MKSDILIFIIALVILGSTFADYLNWLYIQPRPGVVQAKAPSSSLHHLPTRLDVPRWLMIFRFDRQ